MISFCMVFRSSVKVLLIFDNSFEFLMDFFDINNVRRSLKYPQFIEENTFIQVPKWKFLFAKDNASSIINKNI